MISRKEARDLAKGEPQFFTAFCAIAGEGALTGPQYQRVLEEFFYCTYDAYIFGSGDRRLAMGRFGQWLADHHPGIEVAWVFASVDNVHSYT